MNNKDYLSQEEIDALLKQTPDDDSSEDSLIDSSPGIDLSLSLIEQDAIGEIGNITFGSAATALSTLLGKKVEITTPKVSIIARDQLAMEFPKPHVAVHVNYVDGFHGTNLLIIRNDDARVIADLMMGGDGHPGEGELIDIHLSAVQEAMNQMMGSSATSMSTIFNRFVNISPPGIDVLNLPEGEGKLPPEEVFIQVSFRITIGDLIDSNIMQLLPFEFGKEMVASLMGGPSEPPAPAEYMPDIEVQPHVEPQEVFVPPMNNTSNGQIPNMQPPQQPMYQQPPAAISGNLHQRNVNIQPVQFSNLQQGGYAHADETNLDLLLDIPLKVTVELGRTNKVIKDILELSQGSIIELDKLAGEPVDILVNNKLIAKGEVVVIDENFGVRVTDIVTQWDRIQKLQN